MGVNESIVFQCNSESVDGRLRIYNPYINDDGTSKHSVQYALGLKHHFGIIGGTDTHTGWGGNGTTNPQNSKPEKMIEFVREVYDGKAVKGGGLTGVFARELTREGIWEGLLERRTFATTGPRMAVALEIDGTFMGSVLEIMKGKAIQMNGTAQGTEKLELIELVRNGEVVHSINSSGQKTMDIKWIDEDVPMEENYYYLRVVQVDKEMAWSSPVWVKYLGE